MQRRKQQRIGLAILVVALLLSTFAATHSEAQFSGVDDQISMGAFFANYGYPDISVLKDSITVWRKAQDENSVLNMSVLATFFLTEANFLTSLNTAFEQPSGERNLDGLRAVMLQLYGRLIDEMYEHEASELPSTNVPFYLQLTVRDLVLASALLNDLNAPAPLLDCLMRRAVDFAIFDTTKGFLASVKDIHDAEYPKVYGASNLIAAIWTNAELLQLEENSPDKQLYLDACKQYAEAAAPNLKDDYCKSIAYYLLGNRMANDQKDLAWDYYMKSIDLSSDASQVKAVSLAPFYHKDVYVQETVSFVPTYFEYLFGERRYMEIATNSRLLLGCKSGDPKFQERITFWTIDYLKKSMRVLYDEDRFQLYNQLDGELQHFHELYNPVM